MEEAGMETSTAMETSSTECRTTAVLESVAGLPPSFFTEHRWQIPSAKVRWTWPEEGWWGSEETRCSYDDYTAEWGRNSGVQSAAGRV